MEILTKQVETNQMIKKIVDQFMLDEDYNVPDSKSDVQKIIMSEGHVHISEIKPVENYLRVQGKLDFQILYIAEGIEPVFHSMEGQIPFVEMVYMEDGGNQNMEVKQVHAKLQASLIHSRKLRIKAMIELEVESERQMIWDIPIDADGTQKLYKKKKEMDLLELHSSKKDTYRIKEEITLPGTKESIGILLWSDVANRKLDTRLVTDELQISGELLLFCFYESPDGKMDWIEQTIPYQGRVECYGAEDTMYHHVRGSLEDVHTEVRVDEDGETRVIGIEGTLQLFIDMYKEEKTEILEDVYALDCNCILHKKEMNCEQLVLQNHSKCKVMEKISVPELKNEILQICHCSGSVQIDHMEMQEDGVLAEGALYICVLYVKANDSTPFDTWQGVVPFSHLIECNQTGPDVKYYISAILEQLSITLQGGDEIEVKAALAFRGFFKKIINHPMIEEIQVEPIDLEAMEKRPSIVGYTVKEEDDLWTLAKRYSTTMESIREMNEMGNEPPKPGDRILIFKENLSIL